MGLSDTRIRALKAKDKKYKESDGNGLYLLVLPNGGKYWKMPYRYNRRQRELSLGVYPEVTLKEARTKRDEARQTCGQPINDIFPPLPNRRRWES